MQQLRRRHRRNNDRFAAFLQRAALRSAVRSLRAARDKHHALPCDHPPGLLRGAVRFAQKLPASGHSDPPLFQRRHLPFYKEKQRLLLPKHG